MKKISRFFTVLLIIVLSITSTVFAETETTKSNEQLIQETENMLHNSFALANDSFIEYSIENNNGFIKEAYEDYKPLVEGKKIGSFKKFEDSAIDRDNKTFVITTYMIFETGKIKVTVTYDMFHYDQGVLTSIDFENIDIEQKSTLDKLANAGLNTLIGMTTVVIVLLLISWLISLFRFIPIIQEKLANKDKKTTAKEMAIEQAFALIEEKEELTDDTELVAVITAAICASTNSSADGFVVRSIRKVKRNK